MDKSEFKPFLENYFRSDKFGISKLKKSGSDRENYIVNAFNTKFILTYNENAEENESFFYLTEELEKLNVNVPTILDIREDRKAYLQEFAGKYTLLQQMENEGQGVHIKGLCENVLQELSHLQHVAQDKIDLSKAYEFSVYDELPIMHDLFYFKNFFADVTGVQYHKGRLLKEFKSIAAEIEKLEPKSLMLRDFQARNLMISNSDKITFIDYQAAMKGPVTYDLVSFVYQAKANYPKEWREHFLHYYFDLNEGFFTDPEVFLYSLNYCKLIRFLQVMGAYGFRGLIQKKEHFLESIPQGIENLQKLAEHWEEMKKYPELASVISQLKPVETIDQI